MNSSWLPLLFSSAVVILKKVMGHFHENAVLMKGSRE